jgi:hypothetical protein
MNIPKPRSGDDGWTRFLASARQTAGLHQQGTDGTCTGCVSTWGRIVPYPCTQAEWAHAVLDRTAAIHDQAAPAPTPSNARVAIPT